MQHNLHFNSSAGGSDSTHPNSHKLLWGLGAGAFALTLTPFLLDWAGVGDYTVLQDTEALTHVHPDRLPGVGLAGRLAGMLSHTPLVGAALASGGAVPILASAAIGVGGVLLGNWMEAHSDPNARIQWGALIRMASLATSALIALPSILTGVTTGLSYLALLGGDNGVMVDSLRNSIGVAGGHSGAGSLLGAAVPHLLLCGAAFLPVALSAWMGKRAHTPHSAPPHGEIASEASRDGFAAATRTGRHGLFTERLEAEPKGLLAMLR